MGGSCFRIGSRATLNRGECVVEGTCADEAFEKKLMGYGLYSGSN